MDLLFKRYASPFLLLEQMIDNKRFAEFVDDFIETKREDDLIEIWLHKVFDKTFSDFKDECNKSTPQQNNMVNLEATIKHSNKMLNMIIPS